MAQETHLGILVIFSDLIFFLIGTFLTKSAHKKIRSFLLPSQFVTFCTYVWCCYVLLIVVQEKKNLFFKKRSFGQKQLKKKKSQVVASPTISLPQKVKLVAAGITETQRFFHVG